MEIRKAKLSDKNTVLKFCKNTFSWGDYIADVWDKWQSRGGLYVLEDGDQVLGVYHIALFEKESWVEGMRVHPKYRRMGFGKSMMTHAESIARTGIIRLVIESENKPSIKMVEAMGYQLEEEWSLYTTLPQKHKSGVRTVRNISEIQGMINSATYVDSWRWLLLDNEELVKLLSQERLLVSVNNEKRAVGIWNRSSDFPKILQIGYVNGNKNGIEDIIRFVQNKGFESNCEKIQLFVPGSTDLSLNFLDKRALFYLMQKDLSRKIYND